MVWEILGHEVQGCDPFLTNMIVVLWSCMKLWRLNQLFIDVVNKDDQDSR